MLARRSTAQEEMDAPGLDPANYARALRDLARVNRVTRTHAPVLRWLDQATRDWPAGSVVSVLDVASGQGDLLRAIAAWAARRGWRAELSGIDLNPRAAIVAAAATPERAPIRYLTGDVFAYAPRPRPDFIVTSQFTHHLDDEDVVRLLLWLEHHAGRGWFIADLERHALSWLGFRFLARVMFWHPIVRRDGTISIARSFRPAEWRALLDRAAITATVHRHVPFRLCVSRLR